VALLTLLAVGPARAQEEYLQNQGEHAEAVRSGERAGEFVVAPIPIVNPTLGTGLAAVAMYLYQIDEDSYPSLTGIGALYTDSDSKGFGIGQKANFKANAWKLNGGVVAFDLNLDFYGIGNEAGDRGRSIRINQEGWGAGISALRRIAGHWYGGLQYWYLTIDSTFNLPELPPGFPIELPPTIEWRSTIAGLGLNFERDSRDSEFNPYSGSYFKGSYNVATEAFGSDFDFQSVNGSFNSYRRLRNEAILAARISACATPGDAPFYALCKFGQNNDLRGYVGGRYRDDNMIAAQAEYRWRFYRRFGLVLFAGVGGVGPSFEAAAFDNPLPSAGAGLRFMLSEDKRLNLSVDYAIGNGTDALYFYVGESF
jgi:outer membrane protein assembly factor BamA